MSRTHPGLSSCRILDLLAADLIKNEYLLYFTLIGFRDLLYGQSLLVGRKCIFLLAINFKVFVMRRVILIINGLESLLFSFDDEFIVLKITYTF